MPSAPRCRRVHLLGGFRAQRWSAADDWTVGCVRNTCQTSKVLKTSEVWHVFPYSILSLDISGDFMGTTSPCFPGLYNQLWLPITFKIGDRTFFNIGKIRVTENAEQAQSPRRGGRRQFAGAGGALSRGILYKGTNRCLQPYAISVYLCEDPLCCSVSLNVRKSDR